jgi:hypothetical protein
MDSFFGDLPAALFAPAKMAYMAYIILTALKRLPDQPWWEFPLMTLAFLFVEIYHNDYLRIKLNIAAEKHRNH